MWHNSGDASVANTLTHRKLKCIPVREVIPTVDNAGRCTTSTIPSREMLSHNSVIIRIKPMVYSSPYYTLSEWKHKPRDKEANQEILSKCILPKTVDWIEAVYCSLNPRRVTELSVSKVIETKYVCRVPISISSLFSPQYFPTVITLDVSSKYSTWASHRKHICFIKVPACVSPKIDAPHVSTPLPNALTRFQ